MPRYFFDIYDDIKVIDSDGLVLGDLTAARNEAARALAEAAKDLLPGDGPHKDLLISVRDDTGAVVLTAKLSFSAEPPF